MYATSASSEETKLPLLLTYSGCLTSISNMVRKHWNILSINESSWEISQSEPITALKHNKNCKVNVPRV